jgi:hypothetical protein
MIKTSQALLTALVLTACASSAVRTSTERDWVGYSLQLSNWTSAEIVREYQSVSREHRSDANSSTAIRLGLLLTTERNPANDLERARSLFAEANEDPTAPNADLGFATLMQDLLDRLIEQQQALRAETAERQSLEDQLDALKALEERLNVDSDSSR